MSGVGGKKKWVWRRGGKRVDGRRVDKNKGGWKGGWMEKRVDGEEGRWKIGWMGRRVDGEEGGWR